MANWDEGEVPRIILLGFFLGEGRRGQIIFFGREGNRSGIMGALIFFGGGSTKNTWG